MGCWVLGGNGLRPRFFWKIGFWRRGGLDVERINNKVGRAGDGGKSGDGLGGLAVPSPGHDSHYVAKSISSHAGD